MPMQVQAILLAVATGLFWSAAPLVIRYSGANATSMPFFISSGGIIATMIFSLSYRLPQMGLKTICLALLAGLLNGLGIVTFYYLVGMSKAGRMAFSSVSPITYGLVPICIAIGSYLLFKEHPNAFQYAGTSLVVVGIVLLNMK
jgi:drug/metabolite transporter (DMT)-like permease